MSLYNDELQIYQDLLYIVNNLKKYNYFDVVNEDLYLPEFSIAFENKVYKKSKESIKGHYKKDILYSIGQYLKLLDDYYFDIKYKYYIPKQDTTKYKVLINKNNNLINEIYNELHVAQDYKNSITKTSVINMINRLNTSLNRLIIYKNNIIKYSNKYILIIENRLKELENSNTQNINKDKIRLFKEKLSQLFLLKNYFERHDIKIDIENILEKAIYNYTIDKKIDEIYLRNVINNLIKISNYNKNNEIIIYASIFGNLKEEIRKLKEKAERNFEDISYIKKMYSEDYDSDVLEFLISEKNEISKEIEKIEEEEKKLEEEEEKLEELEKKEIEIKKNKDYIEKQKFEHDKEDKKHDNIDEDEEYIVNVKKEVEKMIEKVKTEIVKDVEKVEEEEKSIERKIKDLIKTRSEEPKEEKTKIESEREIVEKLYRYLKETFTKEYKNSNTIKDIYDKKILEYREKYNKLNIKDNEIEELLKKYDSMKSDKEKIEESKKNIVNIPKNIKNVDEMKEKLLSDEAYNKAKNYVSNIIDNIGNESYKDNINMLKTYKNFCLTTYKEFSPFDINLNIILDAYSKIGLVDYYNNLMNLFDSVYIRLLDSEYKISSSLDKKLKEIVDFIVNIN